MKREGSKIGAAHRRPDNAYPAGPCQLYNSELGGFPETLFCKTALAATKRNVPRYCSVPASRNTNAACQLIAISLLAYEP